MQSWTIHVPPRRTDDPPSGSEITVEHTDEWVEVAVIAGPGGPTFVTLLTPDQAAQLACHLFNVGTEVELYESVLPYR